MSAALSWSAWRGWAWRLIPCAALLYAAAVGLAPWSWAAHPACYEEAKRVPYLASATLSYLAWGTARARRPEAAAPAPFALAVSALLDLTIGGISPGAPYDALAAPLTYTTCGVLAAILYRWIPEQH